MNKIIIYILLLFIIISCKNGIINPKTPEIDLIISADFEIKIDFFECFAYGYEYHNIYKENDLYLVHSKIKINDSIWNDTITDFTFDKKKYVKSFIKEGLSLDSIEYCTSLREYKISNSDKFIYFKDRSCELESLYNELIK